LRKVNLKKLRIINLLVIITFLLSLSIGVYAQEETQLETKV